VNEDCFMIFPERNLFIVADGMGGHLAGDIASRLAVDGMVEVLDGAELTAVAKSPEKLEAVLVQAMLDTHARIRAASESNPAQTGMGCSIVIAIIADGCLHVANVGDSRAYVSSEFGLEQLTIDHRNVDALINAGLMTPEEARMSPSRGELSQAMGASLNVDPALNRRTLKPGDRLLLCSDGLTEMMRDEDIQIELRSAASAQTICDRLIEMANARGGRDNITVVVVET
jgi:PPM family protein phosphatase